MGFEANPHWWEVRALTTAPPLLPEETTADTLEVREPATHCRGLGRHFLRHFLSDVDAYAMAETIADTSPKVTVKTLKANSNCSTHWQTF